MSGARVHPLFFVFVSMKKGLPFFLPYPGFVPENRYEILMREKLRVKDSDYLQKLSVIPKYFLKCPQIFKTGNKNNF